MGAAALRYGSKQTPEGMRVKKRTSLKRGKRRAERLDNGVEREAKEGDTSFVPRRLVVEMNSMKAELDEMKEDQYSVTISLQFTQKELERVSGE